MIKVNPLLLMLLIESGLVFLGTAVFFFWKYKGQLAREASLLKALNEPVKEKVDVSLPQPEPLPKISSEEEVRKLKAEIERQKEEISRLLVFEEKFNQLKGKFVEVQKFSSNLKKQLTLVVTKIEKNEELDKIVAEFEKKDKEMKSYVLTLEQDREQLSMQTEAFGTEIERLSGVIEGSVDRSKYEKLSEENEGLRQRIAELEKESIEREKVYEKLVTKYDSLEKEYTILYEKNLI